MRRLRCAMTESLTMFTVLCVLLNACAVGWGAEKTTQLKQHLVEQTDFIQIPGPNPLLTPGPKGSWDDRIIEAADAFEHLGITYFYYHAIGESTRGYQLGVASAPSPLGPFTKHGNQPALELGPRDSWDGRHVACAMIMRDEGEDNDTFYMWYSGCDSEERWSMGLATADHPLGPWTKHADNPVLKDFGYLGGVLKVDGKYRLYAAHPIRMPWAKWHEGESRSLAYHSDYSPLAVAIADRPEGPFRKYDGNPLMVRGQTGDWDDGGISEAEVLYNNGMYHMYYGAVRTYGPRIEGVGYAYSFDGFEWFKYGKNPVARFQAQPNAAAFAEIHAIIEMPYVYLYHTLRPKEHEGRKYPWNEDLGVQVLVMQRPFNFEMPVLQIESLGHGQRSTLAQCPPVCIGNVSGVAITAEVTYTDSAATPIRVHIVSSPDGLAYDTSALAWFDIDCVPGKTARKTLDLHTNTRYIKVMVENSDRSETASEIKVTASLSG